MVEKNVRELWDTLEWSDLLYACLILSVSLGKAMWWLALWLFYLGKKLTQIIFKVASKMIKKWDKEDNAYYNQRKARY